ncbi:TraC family protein [Pengzhenrongella sicca]|uniref:ATP-binding protein n=1 Tax=Pengzhenrongella sicca TaxID=2819238 RepID=A0A8A4ZHR3_9MICO|nr:ATP-binding protein [Pengzhenrongella sicca]QTE30057.1 ATP-binding protein [Pengzhenrongella sicca]
MRTGRFHTWRALRVPAHRASSATLAGAYPFLTAPACDTGVLIGVDALTGGPFCFDPWALYAAGVLTNPNVLLAGVIGQGKSALAKSIAIRSIAVGRRVYVPGDPKGEWAPVAEAVGGVVVRLGPGMSTRLNPLDAGDETPAITHGRRVRLLASLAETTLGRDLRAVEHGALDAALTAAETSASPTIPDVIAALITPDDDAARADGSTATERASDGRDLAHGLRRLVRGDLAGMFDGTSTQTLDTSAPMVVLDLSRLGSNEDALALAMTCAQTWLEAALATPDGVLRWVIYDEAWRLLRSLPLVRRLQSQWKLSRAHGIANLLILHRLSDLDAVGAHGSEARAIAAGLLADCSTRVTYRQESDQLTATAAALGLTEPERDLLTALPRGTGLWKMPGCSHIAHHLLHPDELAVFDTDAAMRDPSTSVHSNPDPDPDRKEVAS